MTCERKPWPRDAVMIVAALAGEAHLERMEDIHPARCRECGRIVHADTFTVRRAFLLPSRQGRAIRFFCVACHHLYDLSTVTDLYDHSGYTGKIIL